MMFIKETLARVVFERVYWVLASLAIALGFATLGFMAIGASWSLAVDFYIAATVLRLGAGAVMNRMGDADTVNAWNNRYHRFVVIMLNAVVGAVLWGRLAWYVVFYEYHIVASVFLTVIFAVYFIAARFTKPNTFGARVRSATLTVVLICVMAHFAWSLHWMKLMYVAAAMLGITWGNLRHLQRRFGWVNR